MGKQKHSGTGQTSATAVQERDLELPWLARKESWSLVIKQLVQDRLITVDGVLSSSECNQLIAAAERFKFQHQGSGRAAKGEAFRDNHRIAVEDSQFALQLWEKCGLSCVAEGLSFEGCTAVGLNPNLRVYRYSEGQRFGKHVDGSHPLPDGIVTGYTLLIYLNGRADSKGKGAASRSGAEEPALAGGETVFYDERGAVLRSVAPAAGMALLHLHGDECYEHEGAMVRAGTKYVLRSDVVFA